MRLSVLFISAGLCLGVGTQAMAAAPLVNAKMGSNVRATDDQDIQLVKKKKSDDGDGEKGWFDYLKMAATFDDSDVVDQVKDGRVIEHLVGGFFGAIGGHIWAPSFAYKDVDAPPAEMALGIVGVICGWLWVGGLILCIIPVIGWYLGWLIFLIPSLVIGYVMNFWVIPRALQFAYSDAYGSGGGSKKSKKKKSDDDDEE